MLNGFGLSVEITIDDIKKIEDELKGKKFICSFDPNVPEKSNIEGETLIQIKEESIIPKLKKLLGGDFAVSSNLEEYALPVIARNNLKDTNLWYEEFVPRHSRFYCVILKTSDCELDIQSFLNEQYIQIGGNASVGYGYCKFELQPKA